SGLAAAEQPTFVNYANGEPSSSPIRVSEEQSADPQADSHTTVTVTAELVDESPQGHKEKKKAKQAAKDQVLLAKERWLVRNGHFVTFIGLYLFSIMVLFRPYELATGLGFLQGTAFYFALGTIAIFLPSQIAAESNLTMLSREVKAILTMTLVALITIPIAKDPNLAWETFNEPFIKAVVIFLILVNVVRTRKRLLALLWLSFGIGIYMGV